jgi:hypothetical protein
MAVIFYLVLTAIIGFLFLIFNHVFHQDSKKKEGIEVITDPTTGRKRKRILEGIFEQGAHDHLYSFGEASVSNVVFIESLVPLEKSVLIEALLSLTKVHPLLRMKCEWQKTKGTTHRYLTEMEKLTSNELIYSEINTEGSKWIEIFEDELLQGFDLSSGPLWRVVRLKEEFDPTCDKYHNTIVFTFHHAICDGVSIMNYFDKLLEVMDKIFYGDLLDKNLEPLPLLEPLMVLLKHHIEVPWMEALSLKVKHALQTVFKKPVRNVFLDRFPPPLQRNPEIKPKTHMIPSSISVEDTAIFLKNCKMHKCTVGGALGASMAISVGNLLNSAGTHPSSQLIIGIPLNARNECMPVVNIKQFGCYIGIVFVPYLFPAEIVSLNDYFWDLARKMSAAIQEKISNEEQYNLLKRMKYTGFSVPSVWESAKKDLNNAGRYHNIELSSRGNYDLDKQRVFKITETHFAVAQEVIGPVLTVTAVTVTGKLSWSVIHSSLAVNQELMNGFAEGLSKLIEKIGCSRMEI